MTEPGRYPVDDAIDELRAALRDPGTAVLTAEPGAGKTTIVPLRLLDEQWLGAGRIVVLEPRRLAARAAARRIADLCGSEVGGLVGVQTRDERRVSSATRIEVVTEGILTRRVQSDPTLPGTGLVVFDEFHERNLQADLGLALALDARDTVRPDLRILVMSATIDTARVATLIGTPATPAPIVAAAGRQHPIDVEWRPRRARDRVEPAVVSAVHEAVVTTPGDVLVFLPGAAPIRRVADILGREPPGEGVDIRPLHGSLSAAEQDAAIAPCPPGRRKVVLSTDIAESSLTVEGITAVVDTGLSRAPRFDVATGMTRLVTVAASRASTDQRAGRAGRLGPGLALRLWSKMEHAARPAHRPAEITEVDLAGLALELALWGTADPAGLRLLDAPPARTLAEGRELVEMLGGLDGGRITALGREMARLPLHPRLARIVLGAAERGSGWAGCVLAALLDDRDVLRGTPDELPVDLADRVRIVEGEATHGSADRRAVATARRRAQDLARRVRIEPGTASGGSIGGLLVLGYPDRIAQRRDGGRGRFRLRTGGGAWMPLTDVLAGEDLVVAADLDGHRKEARIRLAAAVTMDEVVDAFGPAVEQRVVVDWDRRRNDLVARSEARLGGVVVARHEGPPGPGPATEAALLERVRSTRLGALGPDDGVRSLQRRVAFLRARGRPGLPDLTDAALLADLDGWLPPYLAGAVGRLDLDRLDLEMVLLSRLGFDEQRDLDRLAPRWLALPTGRGVEIDYGGDAPSARVRVQAVFGLRVHPTVLDGAVPLVLHLLSPADRPVQVTADLPGFWTGSWAAVRKDMAGRYPKHAWPADPASAEPHRR